MLDKLYSDWRWAERELTIITGGGSWADSLAEAWALRKGLPTRRFDANWDTYGRAAGAIRNAAMAWFATTLIAFPGGAGTANMLKTAKGGNLDICEPLAYDRSGADEAGTESVRQ